MHNRDLAEYVLYELDGDGIRYLLGVFGDQLGGNNGVASGQNPKD